MRTPGRRRRLLVEAMMRERVLSDPGWIAAFQQVPRHAFVPRFFMPEDGRWAAVDHRDEDWLAHVYSDHVLVTQLDEDPSAWDTARRTGPLSGTPTCSSSMPTIMAIMLEELLAAEGDRVLEVGTGTGYNAALLCHRLGSRQVSTVDIDAGLVRTAEARLARCGYYPVCASYDGAKGFPENAPYERVLCTCAVSVIPRAWLEQTARGGTIITTLNRPIGAGLVRVEVAADSTGHGRVLPQDGRFMPLRAHRIAGMHGLFDKIPRDGGSIRPTTLSLRQVLDPTLHFEFFAGLALPGVFPAADPGDPAVTFLLHADGSWARYFSRDDEQLVVQDGPRRLWDLLEAAHQEWQELGEPGRDRFGITVTPRCQEIWLDYPDSTRRWSLSAA